ncbi:glycosyltransferase family 2 protein [Yoonia sp. SS1-5]|uniref:Glycosyltransferase family 2 protein n=1 Tax=Yoonia rhodophyticola TaxID=3137370 RepID=A0AAN0MER2_9RHOB
MPVFSIVMPCYNAAATILETIRSIRAQTRPDWELICVDDGSTDLTPKLIAEVARNDRRIKLVRNPGKGPSAARNSGAVDVAAGDIIAFCDADDIWADEKLTDIMHVFDTTDCDATFGQIAFFCDDPALAHVRSTVPDGPLTIDMLLGENPVCTMSNLSIRKDSLHRFGGLDPAVVHNEDLEWLIRIVGQGGIITGIQSLHVWYRSSPNGLSADLSAMQAGRTHAIKTALGFGVTASRRAEAVHYRYLARRALRMGLARSWAAKAALLGMLQSPRGFLTPPRRGALTLIAAICNLVLPRNVARTLFSR